MAFCVASFCSVVFQTLHLTFCVASFDIRFPWQAGRAIIMYIKTEDRVYVRNTAVSVCWMWKLRLVNNSGSGNGHLVFICSEKVHFTVIKTEVFKVKYFKYHGCNDTTRLILNKMLNRIRQHCKKKKSFINPNSSVVEGLYVHGKNYWALFSCKLPIRCCHLLFKYQKWMISPHVSLHEPLLWWASIKNTTEL